MRVRQNQIKIIILVSLGILLALGGAACQMSSTNSNVPATPTMPLDIPVITADTTKSAVDQEVEEIADAPVAEDEKVVEEESASPTETPKPQATAEPETASDAAAEEVVYAATPTVIPAKSDENPDPMVYIYGVVNCYKSPDVSSQVTGKTLAGTALAAHQRSWNFYQIDHPTIGGISCWITGDSIRPNTEAFALAGPTPLPPAVVKPEATQEPSAADDVDAAADVAEEAAVEPTPTAIPYVYTANPDAMVIFYGKTNCYAKADTDSGVSGVAYGGTALGAFRRDWNWYQVVHPTTGGLVCWVTGDTIRPNQTAYNLGK